MVLRQAIQLHSLASNARLNEDKTELLLVGNPSFDLPYPVAQRPVRYLGILFTNDGIAAQAMEDQLEKAVQNQIIKWHDRQLSLFGRVQLANSVLLAKLWFAAHVVPFSEKFMTRVKRLVAGFLWNSKRNVVKYETITKPKSCGGLGLLHLQRHSLATFGTWITAALRVEKPVWWGEAARWLLEKNLTSIGSSTAILFTGFSRLPRKVRRLDPFWQRTLECWSTLDGKAVIRDDTPMTTLARLPLSHPDVCMNFKPSQRAIKALEDLHIRTLFDLFEHDDESGLVKTRNHPALVPFVQDYSRCKILFCPNVITRMNQIPAAINETEARTTLRIAGSQLDSYCPKQGRLYKANSTVEPVAKSKWRRSMEDLPRQASDWTAIAQTTLEPKHRSLLWRLQHGCVATAKVLAHFVPDLDNKCPVCRTEIEDQVHYFFDCPRVSTFWSLVSQFLQNTRVENRQEALLITLDEVMLGFDKWKKLLPNFAALHGLAMWEIYRAHAEASLDGKVLSATAMFTRWKLTVTERIIHDFFAGSRYNSRIFLDHWARVKCQWFVYDPGTDGQPSRLSFSHAPTNLPNPATIHATFFTAGGSYP